MHYTIELLLKKNEEIFSWYEKAAKRWRAIIRAESSPLDIDSLASTLTTEQSWFERNCGGRHIGQEIMVIVGIAQYYSTDDGFAGNDRIRARKIYKAFRRSYCSLEVKSHAKRIAEDYRLLELDDASF